MTTTFLQKVAILVAVSLVSIGLGWGFITETVETGHVKVAKVFGKVTDTYTEGLNLVNPLASFTSFDIREKTMKMSNIPVPSNDQLITQFDVSIQYNAIASQASQSLTSTGTVEDLVNIHMIPKFQSILREISKGTDNAEDFYNKNVQQKIQVQVLTGLRDHCTPKGLHISEILIRRVDLPKVLREAVERKKRRQQQSEEQKAELTRFKIEQEQKTASAEAERNAAEVDAKKIKLLADAKAYEIKAINRAIQSNPAYVQLQSIKAMEAISKNPANQIYFIDSKSSTPLPLMHLGKK